MDKLQKNIETNKAALDADAQVGRYEGKDKQRLKMQDGRAQRSYENAFEAEFPDSEITAASMFSFANRDGRWGNYDALLTPKFSLREAPDTPEFKAWFKDSKIVTKPTVRFEDGKKIVEAGKPKVMYHGTAQDITEFRPKQAGAIFLTDDPNFARGFSIDSQRWMAGHIEQFLTQIGRASCRERV
jgi:hypothetical protein